MIGWFRNKEATDVQNREFIALGARFGSDLVSSFEKFIESRFGRVHGNYLNVLRGNFQSDIQRTDVPPLESARANYQCFLEQVAALPPQMNAEISLYMDRWLQSADKIGIRSKTEQFFQQQVLEFCSNLSIDGLKLFTDYAIPLKDANDAWRKAYPELAEKWPSET
jgi:hypothetical protein